MSKKERLKIQEELNKIRVQNRAIVATGKCPDCGEELKRNLALAGWWQCAQFGSAQFRKNPNKESCNFQCFTE
jgi:ssDNA-binding Zn-finger/Zn-ribbon topoisomerase 1